MRFVLFNSEEISKESWITIRDEIKLKQIKIDKLRIYDIAVLQRAFIQGGSN